AASFEQIQDVLHTAAVHSTDLGCLEADCERCSTFAESECRADAFCSPLQAQRLDAARGCQELRYAGCERNDLDCSDAETSAVDPEGACWLFPNTCQPLGFGATSSQDPECGYASFEDVPRCAP
ncbi:MAG TPA: hypothetical protein VMG12_44745, partial [Polyangiaceae bacterium]|nr:hypothetical protein [Polyangiaceae bacterium]